MDNIEKLARDSWMNNHIESDNIVDWSYYLKGFQDASSSLWTGEQVGKLLEYIRENMYPSIGNKWILTKDPTGNRITTEELYTMFKEQQL